MLLSLLLGNVYDDADDNDDYHYKNDEETPNPMESLLVSIIKLFQTPSARKESCPFYGEPNKGIKERQRPTICYTYNHHQKCWKGFYLFFAPLSPVPDPMLSKTIMFVPVIVLLYPNIEYEGGGGGGMGDI